MAPNNLNDPVASSDSTTTTNNDDDNVPINTVSANVEETINVTSNTTAANNGTRPKSFWDPNEEKAACGVGFIVNIQGTASNRVSYFLRLNSFYNKR